MAAKIWQLKMFNKCGKLYTMMLFLKIINHKSVSEFTVFALISAPGAYKITQTG